MGRISAFVLINVRTGMIDQVISELIKVVNKNPHVETLYADSTTGKFDIIHMIRSEEMSGLHAFIVGELQNIEGITSTVTEVVTYEPDIKAAREESPESLKCYMLMTVEVGKIEEVLSALASSSTEDSCITKVACTTGEYDVITRIESTDIPSLYSFISQKLHVIGGVDREPVHDVLDRGVHVEHVSQRLLRRDPRFLLDQLIVVRQGCDIRLLVAEAQAVTQVQVGVCVHRQHLVTVPCKNPCKSG